MVTYCFVIVLVYVYCAAMVKNDSLICNAIDLDESHPQVSLLLGKLKRF